MKNFKILKRVTFIIIGVILLLISTNGFVIAQKQANDDRQGIHVVPGGPGYVAISSTAMRLCYGWGEWASMGFELFNPSLSTVGYYCAPVVIPQGAWVTKFIVYYYDASSSSLQGMLVRQPFAGNTFTYMAHVISSTSSGYGYEEDESIVSPQVDMAENAYLLMIHIPANQGDLLRLVGVRIDYSFSTYAPLINK